MRGAFGAAFYDIVRENSGDGPVIFDCDLQDSLRLGKIKRDYPRCLYECGIAEHNAVTAAAAMAKEGIITFAAGFGVFMLEEVYSQLRMADINRVPLHLVATHCGLDVGEDGKTHQCLDYLALLSNFRHIRALVPADPNQTDAMVRYMANSGSSECLCMGRSKAPVLKTEEGKVFFGEGYRFRYGEGHWLREGTDGIIFAMGGMVSVALSARETLKRQGILAGVYIVSCPEDIASADVARAAATGLIVTCEDHFAQSGMGARLALCLALEGRSCKLRCLGVGEYGTSAAPTILYRRQGLTSENIVNIILKERSH
jgi:transketolase